MKAHYTSMVYRWKEKKMTTKINYFRQELVDKMIDMLNSGELFWSSPTYKPKPAFNGVSQRPYQSNNQFMLSMIAALNDYNDPRWFTMKQIKDKGYLINKGERHTKIEYWSLYNKVEKKTVTMDWYNSLSHEEREDIKDDITIISKFSRVFNAKQLTGVPEYHEELVSEPKKIAECVERMSRGMGIEIFETGTFSPFYSPTKDEIEIPDTMRFKSENELNSTIIHELAHATGHSTRLNRNLEETVFGNEAYAMEELRAEISSFFLSFEYDIQQSEEHIKNHSAYIQSWSKAIKEDGNVLFRAIKDANTISDYLIQQDQKQLAKDLHSLGSEGLAGMFELEDEFEMEL